MAGRILLNTSGAPFRVQPQSRRRFEGMYDDGRLTGEDWLRNISNTVQLAQQVAPLVAPLLPAGQQVKQTPFDAAADRAADRADEMFGGAAPVATPENHLAPAPVGNPYGAYEAAGQAVANARTPQELAAAEQALLAAQQQFPTSEMDFPMQQMQQPIPEVGLQQQGLSLRPPAPQMSFAGEPPMMGAPSFSAAPPTPPPVDLGPTLAPDPRQTLADVQAAETDAAAGIMDAAAADVAGLPMFQTIAEAQAALATAAASGDIEAYKRAAAALEYSPLSDVAPATVTDYITGAHIRKAKQQLLAAYKPPTVKQLSALDRARIDNLRSQMSKREQDVQARIADQYRKESDSESQQEYRRILGEQAKVKTDIDRIVRGFKAADMRAGIARKRAGAAQAWQGARKARMFNDFMRDNPEVFEGIQLDKTIQAKLARDAERYANAEMRTRTAEAGKDRRAGKVGMGRGLSEATMRMLAKVDGQIADADAEIAEIDRTLSGKRVSPSRKRELQKRLSILKGNLEGAKGTRASLLQLFGQLKAKVEGGSAPASTPTSTKKPPTASDVGTLTGM